jgi:hypothetical protein
MNGDGHIDLVATAGSGSTDYVLLGDGTGHFTGQDVHRRVGAAIGIGLVTFGVGALMALTSPRSTLLG